MVRGEVGAIKIRLSVVVTPTDRPTSNRIRRLIKDFDGFLICCHLAVLNFPVV